MSEIEVLGESVTAACERFAGDGDGLWRALEQIGVTLLPVPEGYGGAGADLATTGAVLRALGRRGVSLPIVETALLAGWLLAAAGARVPSGPLSAVLAGPAVRLSRDGGHWTLSGRLERVPWGRAVERIVVLLDRPEGAHLAILDRAALEVIHGGNVAGEPRDDLVARDVVLTTGMVRAVPAAGVTAAAFRARGALGRALMICGAAERALELTLRHISQREQFGRTLGGFQAVQHLVARQAGEVAAARAAAESAASDLDTLGPGALGENGEGLISVAAAKVAAGTAATAVSGIAHQLHGALGFTDEHELHRYTTRLWAWRDEYGNEDEWAAYLGRRALAAGGEGLWPLLTTT